MFVHMVLDIPHLTISVLGPLQVMLDGKLVTRFEFDRVRALLAYLAVEPDQPHDRTWLAYMLWPDAPLKTGLENLRQSLAALRRCLNDKDQATPFITATPTTIAVNPASQTLTDLAVFTNLIKAVETHQHRRIGVCESCIGKLEQAVDLYRGEFLQGVSIDADAFDEWLMLKRTETQQKMEHALQDLADYYLRHQQHDKAIRTAQQQLALNSLCDTAHHQLIEALSCSGQRHAAIRHCDQYRQMLDDELMLPLPANTANLCRILSQETWEPSTGCSSAWAGLPKPLGTLVGYEAELVAVRERLASADCRLITLTGIVGSGKSRLALAAGWADAPNFDDGAFAIDLEHTGADEMLAAVARTVMPDFDAATFQPSQLTAWLRDKEILLILDQFDHLAHCHALSVRSLLREAPNVKILITSQQQLGLQGETCIYLNGLVYPTEPNAAGFETFGAVRFFAQSIRRWQPDFTFDDAEDREAFVAICRMVSGNPRALALCAHAASMFSLRALIDEMSMLVHWQQPSSQGVPERQQSLQAMFQSAWQCLSPKEQDTLIHLAVFQGSFGVLEAQSVAQAAPTVLLTLQTKSWLQPQRCEAGKSAYSAARYRIPDLFYLFIQQKLRQNTKLDQMLGRAHAIYFVNYVEQHVVQLTQRPCHAWVLNALKTERANIEQAQRWIIENRAAKLHTRLNDCFSVSGFSLNGEYSLPELLAQAMSETIDSQRVYHDR